jgi:hypothetical protein
MKKAIQIIALLIVVLLPVFLSAQPQPWDPGVGGGETTNPVGGAAPIGEGIILMILSGIVYGVRKYKQLIKKD